MHFSLKHCESRDKRAAMRGFLRLRGQLQISLAWVCGLSIVLKIWELTKIPTTQWIRVVILIIMPTSLQPNHTVSRPDLCSMIFHIFCIDFRKFQFNENKGETRKCISLSKNSRLTVVYKCTAYPICLLGAVLLRWRRTWGAPLSHTHRFAGHNPGLSVKRPF